MRAVQLAAERAGLYDGDALADTVDELTGRVLLRAARRARAGPPKARARSGAGRSGAALTSSAGGPLRRRNFCRRVWRPALQAAWLPPIHFHDLRHTGNQFAAEEGASLRELMDLMGTRPLAPRWPTSMAATSDSKPWRTR